MVQTVFYLAALLVGAAIGYLFGAIQAGAQRRNQARMEKGDLNTKWGVVPGSGMRVAYLLVTLVAIQAVCPLLFANGVQWWVSAGVVAGYGYSLYGQMRLRLSGKK